MRDMFAALLALLVASANAAGGPAAIKQVAAPPDDIVSGVVTLPDPATLGVRSRTALLPVRLTPSDEGGWAWTGVIELASDRDASLAVLSERPWTLAVTQPGTVRPEDLAGLETTAARGVLPASLAEAHAGRIWLRGQKPGPRVVTVRSDRPGEGFLLVDAGGEAGLYTHPTTLRRVVGEPIGLRAWLDGARVTGVSAVVSGPDGVRRTIHADQDGVIRFTPQRAGPHAVRVEARGVDADGRAVVLTTQHLVEVAHASPPLAVTGIEPQDGVLTVRLGGPSAARSITAAEVWGRVDGAAVPVCWVSRLGEGERSLAIDLRWIAMAGVDPASLELRNVREHDVGSYALVAHESVLPIQAAGLTLPPPPDAPERGMLTGVAGAERLESPLVEAPRSRAVSPGHQLLLVHGYCSGGNPFTVSHFTGDVSIFDDPNQSRTLDAFAQLLLSQGSAAKSFGVVGHSQGPMAALHLYTYYWSGLDWAQGPRLIQAVGAPFQGTPLAGNAAVLGQIFGAGCGSNADLTYAGAGAWLSLIPTWARQEVWYWTTSFNDRPFLYDYCNIITDLFLSDPDDGVIERDRGQLPGATNRGHREGWCHTAGMRDPAQTTDTSRNAEMNAEARR